MLVNKSQGGFTLVELLVSIGIVSLLAAIAIPNYHEFRQRANDSLAISDYRNIKFVSKAGERDVEDSPFYFIANQLGPINLPNPLGAARLSQSVRLRIALKFSFLNNFEVSFLELSHDNGGHVYRFIEINGSRIEQVFDK
jgi:type IV pilus assembly protein PilA